MTTLWNTQNVLISLRRLCQASYCVYLKKAGPFGDASSCWLFFLDSGELRHAYTFHKRAVHPNFIAPRTFNSSCSTDQQREVGLLAARNLCL